METAIVVKPNVLLFLRGIFIRIFLNSFFVVTLFSIIYVSLGGTISHLIKKESGLLMVVVASSFFIMIFICIMAFYIGRDTIVLSGHSILIMEYKKSARLVDWADIKDISWRENVVTITYQSQQNYKIHYVKISDKWVNVIPKHLKNVPLIQ